MSEKQSEEPEKGTGAGHRSQCCCHQLVGEGQGMEHMAER